MSATTHLWSKDARTADATLLSAALEACRESLVIVEEGRILRANQAFARLFGYHHALEVQGRRLAEFVPEDYVRALVVGKGNGASTNGYGSREFSGARKDGTRVEAQASYAVFEVDKRSLLVISAHDVTENKRAEQQLRESQRTEAIGRLVGGVAHDFNNLLTGITLYCDLLLAGLDTKSRLRRHVEEIRMAGEHGAALIQQLLGVARHQTAEPRVLSMNEVVSGMRNLLSRLIGENIKLLTALADDLWTVKMDPTQAQQIILNLVLNARDAMPEGGRVKLRTRNRESQKGQDQNRKFIEFTVSDTGFGMAAETRSHLFEPFFTTKERGQGNGLGLATVSDIVKQAGGVIDVESTPGKGTRVTVRLPRSRGKAEAPNASQSNPRTPSLAAAC